MRTLRQAREFADDAPNGQLVVDVCSVGMVFVMSHITMSVRHVLCVGVLCAGGHTTRKQIFRLLMHVAATYRGGDSHGGGLAPDNQCRHSSCSAGRALLSPLHSLDATCAPYDG